VRRFLASVCEEAVKCGHCPVMWATPGGHYDRATCQLQDRELQKLLYAAGGKEYNPGGAQETPVKGDLDGDGEVRIADAVLMQKHLLCIEPLTDGSGDLDGDGSITAVDFTLLKRILIYG
ncbi:MAG: dockerin type I repeat-containing protein, partial [Oscillospiraceae bacterium]|nr:dockerin type I repeat-containing protein [Oscillospiraceae bacterium]